jgi:hypothetical protein
VSNLRRLQATDDPLALPVGVIHHDLDRINVLGCSTRRRSTPTHEPGQLVAQVVIDWLVKSHPHQEALMRRQA